MVDRGPQSPSTELTVTVVVCTHDEARWDALLRALRSLEAQSRAPDEMIVVVDGNPALLDRIRDHVPSVRVVANSDVKGLSGAKNTAVRSARGSVVAFLDDDAAANRDWVERLVHQLRDPKVLGVGGRVVPRWLGSRPSWFPDEFLWVVGCTYKGVPTQLATVRNLYGGCFCIRHDVMTQIGGFRTELGRVGSNGMGCEETELCIRAAQDRPGGLFYYDPDAVIEHDVPTSRLNWKYYASRCFAEGVSKARLTRLVGSRAGLAAERAHAFRTLPAGVLREVFAAVRLSEPARFARAGAIVAGLALTASGYASESLRLGLARRESPDGS